MFIVCGGATRSYTIVQDKYCYGDDYYFKRTRPCKHILHMKKNCFQRVLGATPYANTRGILCGIITISLSGPSAFFVQWIIFKLIRKTRYRTRARERVFAIAMFVPYPFDLCANSVKFSGDKKNKESNIRANELPTCGQPTVVKPAKTLRK